MMVGESKQLGPFDDSLRPKMTDFPSLFRMEFEYKLY